MMYRADKLARFSKSSYARFQSQKNALSSHSFTRSSFVCPLPYKSARQGYNRSDAVISLFYKFAVLPQ